jgi:regulator of replication initiation timing
MFFFKKKKQEKDRDQDIIKLTMSLNSIEYTLNTLVSQIDFLKTQINTLIASNDNVLSTNESFKHQIQIEESLRNQENDIRLLKSKIEKTIQELDS